MALISVYHHSPYPLRVAMATAQGARLDRWRYGGDLNDRVEQAREREYLSPDASRLETENRLAEMLHHAATTVPYYRDHWNRNRKAGCRLYEDLSRWPILTKADVRSIGNGLLSEAPAARRLFEDNTSGTPGSPM